VRRRRKTRRETYKHLLNYYRRRRDVSREFTATEESGGDREDIVAVGREGVAWRGRRERKKGDLSPQAESLVKGFSPFLLPAVSLSAVLRTCDLRCVMQRHLMCVHPRSSWLLRHTYTYTCVRTCACRRLLRRTCTR